MELKLKIEDFEKVFENEANNLNFQKQLINQIENTIISENPIQSEIINFPKNTILVSSPQKIIDMGIKKKFLFLQILSYVSEQERENIRSRQRQGIETARSQGKYKGRKPIDIQNFQEVYAEWKSGTITARKAMELLGGIKPNTFYRRVKEHEASIG